jgi:hypothetical protein
MVIGFLALFKPEKRVVPSPFQSITDADGVSGRTPVKCRIRLHLGLDLM